MPSNSVLSGGVSRRSFLRGSVAASAALALAGCGQAAQSASSDAASSDSSSASGSSASSDLAKISFVLDYTPNTNHTGIYVAKSKGYFADEGLDVEIVQPPEDGADALIGAGGAQMGVSYQDVMANSLSSDQPMPYTAVAAIIQHNTSGIMSRAADGITRPKLMENHTYATWDMPVEQATIKDVVEADGGDYSKISLVPYNVDDEVSGLKANMFDTVWVYEGWAVQNAKVQNYDVNYFSFISIDDVFDYYTPVIAANDDFAKENPDQSRPSCVLSRRATSSASRTPATPPTSSATPCPSLTRTSCTQARTTWPPSTSRTPRPGALSTATAGQSSTSG